jgi:hypothetical protein
VQDLRVLPQDTVVLHYTHLQIPKQAAYCGKEANEA